MATSIAISASRYCLLLFCLINGMAYAENKAGCEASLKKENARLIEYISKYYDLPFSEHDFIDFGKLGCFGGEITKERRLGKSGFIVWENKSIYVGEFRNNQPNGKGVFEHPNGWAYEGTWRHSFPVKGICSFKGIPKACEVDREYDWLDYQPISVDVIHSQYFEPLVLHFAKENPFSRDMFITSDWVGKSGPWFAVSPGKGERTLQEVRSVFANNASSLFMIYKAHFGSELSGKNIVLSLAIKDSGDLETCNIKKSDFSKPDFEKQICESVSFFYFGKKSLGKLQSLDFVVYF